MSKLTRRILRPINNSVSMILGLYNTLIGIWMLLPFNSTLIGQVFPELLLGLISVAAGSSIVIGVFLNKYFPLLYGALAGFYFWFVVMVMLIVEHWQTSQWITASVIAGYCCFVYLNLKVNKKYTANLHDKK